MSLALYNNQFICLINDGSTSVWALEEIENFQFSTHCLERRLDYFEDDWGFKWTLLHDISIDINIKCHGYLPLRSLHQLVLMCNLAELHFILYDLMIGICLQITLNDVSMLHNFDSHSPLFQHHSPLIENGNMFGGGCNGCRPCPSKFSPRRIHPRDWRLHWQNWTGPISRFSGRSREGQGMGRGRTGPCDWLWGLAARQTSWHGLGSRRPRHALWQWQWQRQWQWPWPASRRPSSN